MPLPFFIRPSVDPCAPLFVYLLPVYNCIKKRQAIFTSIYLPPKNFKKMQEAKDGMGLKIIYRGYAELENHIDKVKLFTKTFSVVQR